MKPKHFLWTAILLQGLLLISCGPKDNLLTDQEKQEGWKLLFDGKTLDGWRDFKGEGVITAPWTAEKGTLTALGKGSDSTGYIVTTNQYSNFILTFDWKISEGGNSGVLYHVLERPEYKTPYVSGPEYQVVDDLGWPGKLEEWQKSGADYAMYAADSTKKNLSKAGSWNSAKIVFDNGHVEYWLNEEKIVEFEAWSEDWFARKGSGKWENAPEYGLARKGVFALQDHGSRSWYKNIKIKELPMEPKEADLFNGKDLTGWDLYGTELWYVENGELVCESGPDKKYGYFGTKKYYDNFDLSVDFMQLANGNSGVFIRSYIKKDVEISGWQVEVAPQGHDTGGIYESYGRGWIIQIPDEMENILKKDEWNTLRIRMLGNTVTTWLNGVQMVDLTDEKIGQGQGRILLQIHDGGGIKVRWKNLHIKELAPDQEML